MFRLQYHYQTQHTLTAIKKLQKEEHMWRRVVQNKFNDVSEEYNASIFRIEE
jgi:rhamnogalacturonyl hydrolase YesR